MVNSVGFKRSSEYQPADLTKKKWGWKILDSRPWPFGFTWRHRSRDHWTRNERFLIGSQYEPTMYLTRLLRYWAWKILESPWPFGDMQRHLSGDHWTRNMRFFPYRWSIWADRLSRTVYEILRLKYIGDSKTDFTSSGQDHVTLSFHT